MSAEKVAKTFNNLQAVAKEITTDEMIGQLCEECGELIQVAQKLRRSCNGTTKMTQEECLLNLTEECADVVNCIDLLIEAELIPFDCFQHIRGNKAERWKRRIVDGDWSE